PPPLRRFSDGLLICLAREAHDEEGDEGGEQAAAGSRGGRCRGGRVGILFIARRRGGGSGCSSSGRSFSLLCSSHQSLCSVPLSTASVLAVQRLRVGRGRGGGGRVRLRSGQPGPGRVGGVG